MKYYQKYLKYKSKYLKLKFGGDGELTREDILKIYAKIYQYISLRSLLSEEIEKEKQDEQSILELSADIAKIKDSNDLEFLQPEIIEHIIFEEKLQKWITKSYGFNVFLNGIFKQFKINKSDAKILENLFKIVKDGTLDNNLTDTTLNEYMKELNVVLDNCSNDPFVKNNNNLYSFIINFMEALVVIFDITDITDN
jgi:chorismate mutase